MIGYSLEYATAPESPVTRVGTQCSGKIGRDAGKWKSMPSALKKLFSREPRYWAGGKDLSYATASHVVPSLNLGRRILGPCGFRWTNLGGLFDRSLPGSPDRILGQLPGRDLRYILPVIPGSPKWPSQSYLNRAATLQISASASRGLLPWYLGCPPLFF